MWTSAVFPLQSYAFDIVCSIHHLSQDSQPSLWRRCNNIPMELEIKTLLRTIYLSSFPQMCFKEVMLLVLMLLIHTFSVLSLQLEKLR